LAITGLALSLTGMANGLATAALYRFFAGAGGGANVPMMGLNSAWFSSERRGLASGITVSGSSFALLLTGFVLPPIMAASSSGWRNAWYLLGSATIVIAAISLMVIRDRPAGMTKKKSNKQTLSLRMMKSKAMWLLAGLYLLFGFSYVIFVTFFARYLRSEALLAEQTIGRLWSLIGGLSIASGFLWGFVSDRFGRRTALVWIFALQSAGYFTFAVWQAMPGYIVATLLFAVTAWSIPAVMAAAVGDFFGATAAPAVLGFITLIFGIGQTVGPTVAGAIADAASTFKPAFLLAAIVALAGAPLSLFIRSRLPGGA
jgi:nitrate/nitrite transporter NarK